MPQFNPEPWLQDLDQVREAVATKYADLEWDVFERGLDLKVIFAEARGRLTQAHTDAQAREIFEDLARHFGDRHVGFYWGVRNEVAAAGAKPLEVRVTGAAS